MEKPVKIRPCPGCGFVLGCNAHYPNLSSEDFSVLKDLGYDITTVAGGHYQIASPPSPNGKFYDYNAAVCELHRVKCLQPVLWAETVAKRPTAWARLQGDPLV